MAETSIATGIDTWVNSATPNSNGSAGKYPVASTANTRQIFVSLPLAIPAGTTVLAGTLSVPVQTAWAPQTVAVQRCGQAWKAGKLTYSNRPSVTGAAVNTAVPATAAGERIGLDVTALVQAIVDGAPNYGFRISTNSAATNRVYGFDSGEASWVLQVETSDQTPAPTTLTPAGVISRDKWWCQVEEYDDLAAMRVQVSPTMSAAVTVYEVATAVPRVDLAATAYPGLADAATTYWRAAVKTTDGDWSGWSDWVEVTRHVKPSLVMINPSGFELWDATPEISAELDPDGDAETRWQVIVTDLDDPTAVRYNSGDDLTGAVLDHQVPLRWKGRVVFPTDTDYELTVRAWDRVDRVPSYGDPTHVTDQRHVTLDTDGDVTPPFALSAAQPVPGRPSVRLQFYSTADPDRFQVRRNGKAIAVLDPDDVRVSPGVFEWDDLDAPPNTTSTWRVRNVVGGIQSPNSPAAALLQLVEGFWIRSRFGDAVLDGSAVENLEQTDKRTTYLLPFRPDDIDIVTAVAGYSGEFTGSIDDDQDVDAAREVLARLRAKPATEVQAIWGTVSIPARLRGLSVSPSPDLLPERNRLHTVKFGIYQTGEF